MRDPDRVPRGRVPPFEEDWGPDPAPPSLSTLDTPDPINPPHYRQSDIECIEAMRACSTREEYEGHLRLTVLKYLWRLRDKGDAVENARKAQWYLGRLVESLGEE